MFGREQATLARAGTKESASAYNPRFDTFLLIPPGGHRAKVRLNAGLSMKITGTAVLFSTLFAMTFSGSCGALAAQTAVSQPAVQQARVQDASAPSAILQPALDGLQRTLGLLRTDKWKASGEVRKEAEANIGSIRRDLESTLPPLLATADGGPDSVARMLPVFRNVEALYDVLLRVAAAGDLAAPGQQSAAIEEARARLEEGRRALGDRLQAVAVAEEQQVRDLQAAVHAVPAAAAPVACVPQPPVKKHGSGRRKTVKKPAAALPAT